MYFFLGEPLRRGVPSALACSRRAIRSITFALTASRFRARWFRYYPSRKKPKATHLKI
jgi:hypothetical protein